jgi:hypothetical protein
MRGVKPLAPQQKTHSPGILSGIGLIDDRYCSGQSHPFRGGMKVIDWRHEPVSHFFS